MKILQIVHGAPFLNQAGTEIYAQNLSLELVKRHEVYVFSRTCDTKKKEYDVVRKDISGVKVYLINNTFRECDSFEKYYENSEIDKKFSELIDDIKPDIVHIQHLVFLSLGLIREIKRRYIPIVFTLHDFWLMCPRWNLLKKCLTPCEMAFKGSFNEECAECLRDLLNIKKGVKDAYALSRKILPGFLLRWFKKAYLLYAGKTSGAGINLAKLKKRRDRIKELLKDVDFFLAPSEYMRNRFIDFGVSQEKIIFSRHGFNKALFLNKDKIKSDKLRFGFIGTILPAKGVGILIKAFNGINGKNAELKIYGELRSYAGFEGYLSDLKRIVKNKNIRFMGGFNHSEISNIFREIDVLIVPSIWHENAPLVISEAFLSKTPVMASDIGGIPELIRESSLLFKPGGVEGLRGKIEHITRNPGIIEGLKKNIQDVKTMEENAEEIEKIYADLAGKLTHAVNT